MGSPNFISTNVLSIGWVPHVYTDDEVQELIDAGLDLSDYFDDLENVSEDAKYEKAREILYEQEDYEGQERYELLVKFLDHLSGKANRLGYWNHEFDEYLFDFGLKVRLGYHDGFQSVFIHKRTENMWERYVNREKTDVDYMVSYVAKVIAKVDAYRAEFPHLYDEDGDVDYPALYKTMKADFDRTWSFVQYALCRFGWSEGFGAAYGGWTGGLSNLPYHPEAYVEDEDIDEFSKIYDEMIKDMRASR